MTAVMTTPRSAPVRLADLPPAGRRICAALIEAAACNQKAAEAATAASRSLPLAGPGHVVRQAGAGSAR
jgi:hypothetical protein